MRSSPLLRLIRRFHRQRVVAWLVRAAGRSGLLLIAGTLSAMLLSRWISLHLLLSVTALAALGCAGLHFRRFPGLIGAATALDRQRETGELYSTALLALRAAAPLKPLARATVAIAERRAERECLDQLHVGGYAPVTWMATLLLAGVLALMCRASEPTFPSPSALASGPAVLPTPVPRADRSVANPTASAPAAEAIKPEGGTAIALEDGEAFERVRAARPTSSADLAAQSPGGGLARSGMRFPQRPERLPLLNAHWTGERVGQVGGGAGAGAGAGGAGAPWDGSGEDNARGTVAAPGSAAPDRAVAGQSITPPESPRPGARPGQSIPAAYQDILQHYFER